MSGFWPPLNFMVKHFYGKLIDDAAAWIVLFRSECYNVTRVTVRMQPGSNVTRDLRREATKAEVHVSGVAISPTSVEEQLDRILTSRHFARAKRLSRMLRFVVHSALSGTGEPIKEYTLGVEVFDRGPQFDPRIDPTTLKNATARLQSSFPPGGTLLSSRSPKKEQNRMRDQRDCPSGRCRGISAGSG